MKQTSAVEWLFEKLDIVDYSSIMFVYFEQAKEMEKEQIIDAYNTSFILRDKPYSTAEKYYTETFKSE
jgi:hypothetical protein